MLNKIYGCLLLIAALGMITFSSCSKENQDDMTMDDDDTDTEVVVCEIELGFSEDGDGLSALVEGATLPIAYEWSTGSTEAGIATEPATAYGVVVTDAEGCVAEGNFTTAPADGEGNDCEGFEGAIYEIDAVVGIDMSGGTQPYNYVWSNEATTPEISAEAATTYTVTVTDAAGCTITSEITTGDGEVDCNNLEVYLGQDGPFLYTEAGGGTPPYTYTWSTGETGTSIGVEPGTTYTVTATDANGCTVIQEITTEDAEIDCSSFGGVIYIDANGDLAVDLAGGTAPYFYEWSNGSTGETTTGSEGAYTVVITDANGCTTTDAITIGNNTDCDNSLTLSAATSYPVNFSGASEAHLFRSSCDFNAGGFQPNFDHNYIILDVAWDDWGTNQPVNYFNPSDGIPGITIGSNGVPQVGEVLGAYGEIEPLFYQYGAQTNYETTDVVVTITETGNSVGEYIGGTISGTMTNQNDASDTAVATGSFCVQIVSVCE